ncbi:MAG: TetR/AcrR family transcriptional regulator [Proteiniphilum sp.]|jgi:AcrR family transcriptional regulator|uniref:TetR/AcrR family transcriptional regulator n=1 Tax=Proteiniphilum sp. TaxID=1926877 RepID=UPI002B1FB624|nr:TetR/AcrR family transcriptional regulator [Proteiniphilum sp.]MEA5129696.1 TetR/AcrR family transcriptional regulator [Proteiniphilum sp.]
MTKKEISIIETARRLFFGQGIKETSVETIVNEARVSKRTFYKYFSDKTAILEKVLLVIIDETYERLSSLVEEAKETPLTLNRFLQLYELDDYDFLFGSDFTVIFMKDYPELLAKLTEISREKIIPKYEELVRLAISHGILRPDMDIEFFILYSFYTRKSMREGILYNQEIIKKMGLKDYFNKFHDYFLNGVVSRQ